MNRGQSTPSLALYLPSVQGGGAERVMVTLANGFAARGLRVDLVLASAVGPYLGDVASNVRVVDLRANRLLASFPRLVRYLRSERPTVLLSALNHVNVVAVTARWLARVPTRVVVSEHNHLSLSRITAKPMLGLVLTRLVRWAYPRADHVVAVSKGVADDLVNTAGFPRHRIRVIYNPVVSPSILERSQEQPEHPWFDPGQPPVILAVGRLTLEKDFSLLIQAFAYLRKRKAARLMILGEGNLRHELESMVRSLGLEEDVLLPGFVSNPYAYMRKAASFVLSSRSEGLPTSLIEAMACGAPVVATDCPSGPAEILEDGRWGRLVPVGDPQAMAEALEQVLASQQSPRACCRAFHFSTEPAVDAYLQVLGIAGSRDREFMPSNGGGSV